MPDIVGKDDPEARDTQRLSWTIESIGEDRIDKLPPRAAGDVQDHHGVIDLSACVAVRLADSRVAYPHFGKCLARAEAYVTQHELCVACGPWR